MRDLQGIKIVDNNDPALYPPKPIMKSFVLPLVLVTVFACFGCNDDKENKPSSISGVGSGAGGRSNPASVGEIPKNNTSDPSVDREISVAKQAALVSEQAWLTQKADTQKVINDGAEEIQGLISETSKIRTDVKAAEQQVVSTGAELVEIAAQTANIIEIPEQLSKQEAQVKRQTDEVVIEANDLISKMLEDKTGFRSGDDEINSKVREVNAKISPIIEKIRQKNAELATQVKLRESLSDAIEKKQKELEKAAPADKPGLQLSIANLQGQENAAVSTITRLKNEIISSYNSITLTYNTKAAELSGTQKRMHKIKSRLATFKIKGQKVREKKMQADHDARDYLKGAQDSSILAIGETLKKIAKKIADLAQGGDQELFGDLKTDPQSEQGKIIRSLLLFNLAVQGLQQDLPKEIECKSCEVMKTLILGLDRMPEAEVKDVDFKKLASALKGVQVYSIKGVAKIVDSDESNEEGDRSVSPTMSAKLRKLRKAHPELDQSIIYMASVLAVFSGKKQNLDLLDLALNVSNLVELQSIREVLSKHEID